MKTTRFDLRVAITSESCDPESIVKSLRNKLNDYFQELDEIVKVELVNGKITVDFKD